MRRKNARTANMSFIQVGLDKLSFNQFFPSRVSQPCVVRGDAGKLSNVGYPFSQVRLEYFKNRL
jgi:hypothetical protein